MKPKILLSLPKTNQKNYISAFSSAGFDVYGDYLATSDFADGLVLCGGGDIAPEYYGESNNGSQLPDKSRDIAEFSVFEKYYSKGKPIFGICRGMQIINVATNGTLEQDLKTSKVHQSKNGDVFHMVKNIDKTPAYFIFGESMLVNSAHHQSCKKIGNGLKIMQKSRDDVVEGIFADKLLGVQWHPERMFFLDEGKENDKILKFFEYFKNIM